MTSRFPSITSLLIIMILGLTVGAGIVYMSNLYTAANLKSYDQRVGANKRIVKVEYINLEQNLIFAETVDRDIQGIRKLVFSIDADTQLAKQDPILKNDIVVSFTPSAKIQLSDLQVGSELFVHITVLNDGRLYATSIVLGSPFARP